MRALIAGGAGFVGLALTEHLLEGGHDVVVLDRGPVPEAAQAGFARLPGRLAAVALDIRDADAVAAAFREHAPDAVFCGAAVTSGPAREANRPADVLSINLLGLVAVLEGARQAKARRVINISSTSAYGDSAFKHDPLVEDAVFADPQTLYAITKFASERVARRLAGLWGDLDIRSVRLSGVFGAFERDTGMRDTLSPQMQASLAALRGRPAILPRREERDWTYSKDIARALAALMQAPSLRHDLYNVGTRGRWGTLDWCARLKDVFPGFEYRLAAPGEAPTIDLHGDTDRGILDTDRLTEVMGPGFAFDLDRSFGEFRAWLAAYPGYWG